MAVAAEQLAYESHTEFLGLAEPAPKVGERALWGAGVFVHELGINDPLTHLEQYLEHGEATLPAISEDLVTDIAERMLKPTFINQIKFDRVGNDFISRENKFSMRGMTANTEDKFSNGNIADIQLYKRAKIESDEVARLDAWFQQAENSDVFIVESMGLTPKEKYTIVRIYEKTSQAELVEHVVTLHNATVDAFNELHHAIGADVPQSQNVLELLGNMYAHKPQNNEFVEDYIQKYDGLLAKQNPGQEFSFGLPKTEKPKNEDDITAIRRQTALRRVYTDTLRALGLSGGQANADVIRINHQLGLNINLANGQPISSAVARQMLDASLQSIVATLNRASPEVLEQLAASNDIPGAYSSAGEYGGQARSEGVRYDGACPSGSGAAAAQEAATIAHDRRIVKTSAECVYCPNCEKVVNADKEYFDRGWWRCPDCSSIAPRHGVRQRSLEDLKKITSFSAFELIARDFKKITHELNIKGLMRKQAAAETEFERRRQARQLEQELTELQKLQIAA